MALDFAPPRYAQLVTTIQDRISSGRYASGSVMPTEAQLAAEFDVSRATVVRALQLLKADGWVESRQGRGTFVRGRPAVPDPVPPRRGADALALPEKSRGRVSVEVQHAGPGTPPAAVGAALRVGAGEQAVERRRVLSVAGEPTELVSSWFPVDVVEGTDLGSAAAVPEGVTEHLRRRKGIVGVRVSERVTARMPTAAEVRTLAMPRRVPVLDVLVTAYDADGRPVQVVALVLPGDRHELEDTYTVEPPAPRGNRGSLA